MRSLAGEFGVQQLATGHRAMLESSRGIYPLEWRP